MTKKVLKFGGTSVGSIQRIVHAAKIIKKEYDSGNQILVVVSAMAGTTNNLAAHSKSISKKFSKRESGKIKSKRESDEIKSKRKSGERKNGHLRLKMRL